MFFLLPLIGAAVGAAVGALVTHTAGEKDRQAAEHHRKVANDLSNKYSNLTKTYNEYAEKSKNQISDLTKKHAIDEAEKDLRELVIELQQSILYLMLDIDERPTPSSLQSFRNAVESTNKLLIKINKHPIQVPNKYFSRNLKRVKRREKLAESKKKKLSQAKS